MKCQSGISSAINRQDVDGAAAVVVGALRRSRGTPVHHWEGWFALTRLFVFILILTVIPSLLFIFFSNFVSSRSNPTYYYFLNVSSLFSMSN